MPYLHTNWVPYLNHTINIGDCSYNESTDIRFTYTTKPSPTFFYYLSGNDRPEETAVFIIVPKNNFRWIN